MREAGARASATPTRRRGSARTMLLAGLVLAAGSLLLGAVVFRSQRQPASPVPAAPLAGARVPGPTAAEEGYPTFEAAPPPRMQTPPPAVVTPPSPSPRPAPAPRDRVPRRRPTPVQRRERERSSRSSQAPSAPRAAPAAGELQSTPAASGQDADSTISSPGAATDSGSTPGPAAEESPPALTPPTPGPAADALPSVAATPVLTPPVPLETPPLDPVLRATIIPGPDGQAAAGETSVRGKVRVRLLIRADGTVARVEVLTSSGDSDLDERARRGLLTWRFSPARRDGVPIDSYVVFWVAFRD